MKDLLGFPNPVNEKAARLVAAGVALIALVGLVTGWRWLLIVLAVGFWARVAAGPTLSPLGRIASDVIAPRLGPPRYVPGPPKRFAQTIGAVLTTVGAVLEIAFAAHLAADAVLGVMLVFATLESVFALCMGCQAFALLMRLGVIPESVCEECANVSLRRA